MCFLLCGLELVHLFRQALDKDSTETVAVWTGFHVCLTVDTLAGLTRKDRQSSWILAAACRQARPGPPKCRD
jgi:hypothetical protein